MAVVAPYRIKITVLAAKVSGTLTGFPVYVNLADLPAAFFSHVISGADIRVTTADGGTEVPYELVAINTGAQTGHLWFKGDISSSANTDFYIYYGSPGYAAYSASAPYGSQSVWGANAKYVSHMEDGAAADSSSAGLTATITGATETTGKIGDGLDFTTSDQISLSGDAGATTEFATKLWFRADNLSANRSLGFRLNGDSIYPRIRLLTDGSMVFQYRIDGATKSATAAAGVVVAGNEYRVSVGIDVTTGGYLRLGGVTVATNTDTGASIDSGSSAPLIGNDTNVTNRFDGMVDEYSIWDIDFSEGYDLTEFNNQFSPSTFYSVSSEESFTGSGFPRLSAAGFVPNLTVGSTIKPKVWLA